MARPSVHAGEARRYHQVPRLNVAVRLGSPSMVEAMTRGSVRRCQCWLLLRRSHSKKWGIFWVCVSSNRTISISPIQRLIQCAASGSLLRMKTLVIG